ncbi:MAG: hypothetical protein ACI87A_002836, partial [Planctomycetota bacterium]
SMRPFFVVSVSDMVIRFDGLFCELRLLLG